MIQKIISGFVGIVAQAEAMRQGLSPVESVGFGLSAFAITQICLNTLSRPIKKMGFAFSLMALTIPGIASSAPYQNESHFTLDSLKAPYEINLFSHEPLVSSNIFDADLETSDSLSEESALVNELGGGLFWPNRSIFVPKLPSLIQRLHRCETAMVNNQIKGSLPPHQFVGWNDAQDHETLHSDAQQAKTLFVDLLEEVANHTGVEASFGPGNAFATKTPESLFRKIHDDMENEGIASEEATRKIGDALRGSIIVESEDSIPTVVDYLNKEIEQMGGKITYKNLFGENRENGYVGLHAKMLFPFENEKGEKRQILSEIQIHFRSVCDGTKNSRKERAHELYKGDLPQSDNWDSILSRVSSVFTFLSGLVNRGDVCKAPATVLEDCKLYVYPVDICSETQPQPEVCRGNLGIPRAEMPQLKSTTRAAYLDKKAAEGVQIERKAVPAKELTPVQNQLNREKVDQLLDLFVQGEFNPCEKEILVSFANKNNVYYVIDGHHRYAACRIIDGDQKIIAIYENVEQLLKELEEFPGVTKASLAMAMEKHAPLKIRADSHAEVGSLQGQIAAYLS